MDRSKFCGKYFSKYSVAWTKTKFIENQISKRTFSTPEIWMHEPGIGSKTISFNIEIPLKTLSMFFFYILPWL